MPPASPKSIPAADLAKLTQAAVKKVTGTGRIVKGPLIWGYVLNQELKSAKLLEQATAVTAELATAAKAAGRSGLKAQPSVVIKPGKIIAGYIDRELNYSIE
jgi:hypothetical protein